MRSWPAPAVPVLPGRGLPLRLTDSSTGAVRATEPGPVATMYVCGITPYDATHLGHAATYIAFDLVHRQWLDGGHEVHYVQNVTDVDDPLLERAVRDGVDWQGLAEEQTTLFREDMTALGVIPPREYIGAVEAIPLVVSAVQTLTARGAAYDVDGDTYFSVGADPGFGSVAGLPRDQMIATFAERGGDPDRPGKKDPLDCLLWQSARPGEPAWDTDLGSGRPGWHIECTSIALEHLGMGFDVQGGGSDLVFPHHEMGASEAAVLTGESPYAKHYVHAGMVGLDGEKMSKSRGNLVFVSRLRADGVDPMAIRLALLAHHYRSDWEWTDDDLVRAQERLARWRDAVGRPDGPSGEATLAAVRERLADDLDAPGALEAIDAWAAQTQAGGASVPTPEGWTLSGPGLVSRTANALLGIRL